MSLIKKMAIFSILYILIISGAGVSQEMPLGFFDSHGDIGKVLLNGSAVYDAVKNEYIIAGSGVNMWATEDAMHFVWKQITGDVELSADIQWIGEGGNPHRKACLLIRQSLEPNSAYADVAVHGDGLTSLQFRDENGGLTHEVQANVKKPKRVTIIKEGDLVYLEASVDEKVPVSTRASFKIKIKEPFYIGMSVCAHDSAVLEKAIFSNVVVIPHITKQGDKKIIESTLETISIASTDRKVVYHSLEPIKTANWSADGNFLNFQCGENYYRIPVTGGEPAKPESNAVAPLSTQPELSPDRTILYYSEIRNEKYNIYSKPAAGGEEKQLTNDEFNNRFPHPSPDGKWIVFLAYAKNNQEFTEYTDVLLRMMPAKGGDIQTLAKLTGGPGTLEAPSWSPDSGNVAFTSFRIVNP